MDVAIKVDNVSKVYKLYDKPIYRLKESLSIKKKVYHKTHYALDKISFEVKKGETVGIIGTNGSGKSTLLKIITGVLNPTEGNVFVDGRISALLELGAGFNLEYTGIENIYLNGTMLGYSKLEIEERLSNILDFAAIGEFIYQPVKTYSSGMFVRLAFAVAINIEPEILIVDEALSVGDIFFQSKCYSKFEEFKKNGKTILIVTHDLGSVVKYCDKAILIDNGKFLKEDKPKEIVDLYKKIIVNEKKYLSEELTMKLDQHLVNENSITCWKDNIIENPQKSDYGNKMAEIIDYGIFDEYGNVTNNIVKGTEFKIKIKVKFNEIIENPIVAFTIRDVKGNEITGTNTMFENLDIFIERKNIIKTIEFNQSMNLQGGEYLLCLGCTGFVKGELVVYNRLYEICNISVISSKNTVGFFDINSKVSIV